MIMGRWSEFSVCMVVRLYSVVEIVVMSGEVACCSVVCGTLVGVSVFSMMCSELQIDLYGRQYVSTRVLSVRSRRL